jgi:hypothetical protein
MARIFLAMAFMLLSGISFSQVREIPAEVKETFESQYPDAEDVKYEDKLVSVQVLFTVKGEKMVASYTNKGKWKETEKEWSFEQLPEEVKDGFQKSKYAEWKVVDTKIVYRPGGSDRYRVKVEKSDIQKKNIFFNTTGRLTDEDITL